MKTNLPIGSLCGVSMMTCALFSGLLVGLPAQANPTGGSVVQGTATINTSGSQLTVNQSSASAFINWSTFNIGLGETTTFVQPSAASVSWNQINDSNPSQILGNLDANGLVVLQNQSGFYVGGSAAISAHGLIMTTASTPTPDLSSGGPWTFNTPPPTAKIINYGQINISGGGSAFLIASDIENNGTISAPGGKIGLYAGQQVLVSTSPDGRGLSAQVTLPEGSVNNQGQLIADAGTIAAQAKFVNQNGLIQANSVQNINGVIELVASDTLTLGNSSVISASGDAAASTASPGGFVVLKSNNTYADTATSQINVSGQSGGQDGIVEIFGSGSFQSSLGSYFALLINPYDVTLSSNPTDTSSASPNFNIADLASYSRIDLHALDNIQLSANWSLIDPGSAAALSLQAGNSIILNDGAGINAGNNWSVNLMAGTDFVPTLAQPTPLSGSDGIYLNGSAYVQTRNGDINVWAANEVLIATGSSVGNNGIRTVKGGNINVTALYGDVNTGSNPQGFGYTRTAPYYTVSPTLGGISTAAGGNVTINAGGSVYSYLPLTSSTADAGTGAFGSAPGNVTITAGGGVYGHYVLNNGVGTITAGGDVGNLDNAFALSLFSGSWSVNAPNGNIYLQEVRNPNGVFNNVKGIGLNNLAGQHLFNYSPTASVNLDAGIGVYLTDLNLPRPNGDVPVVYPSIVNITAGSGGVTLGGNVALFPSPNQNLTITTTDGGSLVSNPNAEGSVPELLMSDSPYTVGFGSNIRWIGDQKTFTDATLGLPSAVEPTALNPVTGLVDPVTLNISGSMENLTLVTTKETHISIGGDMINCGFSGQNLRSSDITSITVGGQIYNRSSYSFVYGVTIPSVPASDLPSGMGSSWDSVFTLAVDPTIIANLTVPANLPSSQWATYAIESASLFTVQKLSNGQLQGANPGFVYNPTTGRLGYAGQMSQSVLSDLTQPITILHLVNGVPVLDANGHFVTDTISWADPTAVTQLFTASTGAPSPVNGQIGYRVGGPGQFDINAGSISLGNSYGILSCGVEDPQGGFNRYNNLASLTPAGATVNVTVAGNLDMLTSTIAAIGGGDVNVVSTGGSLDLGSQELFNTQRQVGFGIFTSGNGNVNVTAFGDIDINGSRIAAFNGGDIFIESLQGSVNVGSGGNTFNGVGVSYVDPVTGQAAFYAENVYGSGIVANTLVPGAGMPPDSAKLPGNITVKTPRGNITASLGGITQEALNGSIGGGPTITLVAGTPASGGSPGYTGNIDLGKSGVIGGTVNITANGNITGLVISRQNSTIQAANNFSGAVLSGGSADVSGGGSVSGVIVGVGGANVSGGSVSAEVLSQNASVNGGASQSTLGTSATATSTSQSAAQQASSDTKHELATNDDSSDDDKKKKSQSLVHRIKRVTVLLPKI